MVSQAGQQNQFSRQIIRQPVNDQAAAQRLNNPVPMVRANPFAMTVENPWLGINQMLLGSNNMVVQPTTTNAMVSGQGEMTNMAPDGRVKRSRAVNHFDSQLPVPPYAPATIQNEMKALLETDRMLMQQSKSVRMEYAAKHDQAVTNLVESVRAPLLVKLQEKDAQISSMGQLIAALQQKVQALNDENLFWKNTTKVSVLKARAFGNSLGIVQTELNRMQGDMPPNDAVVAPPEEQEVESYCGSNVSEKNRQRKAKGAMIVEAEPGEIEKVQTGEGTSGEKKMCKSCGKVESSFLVLPCMHLCFCVVCGPREAGLHGPCPVCATTMSAAVKISLL